MTAAPRTAGPTRVSGTGTGAPTDVVDTSALSCGTDPALRALGPAELVPPDPRTSGPAHPLATTAAGPRLAGLLEVFDTAPPAQTPTWSSWSRPRSG